eukprot:365198-Chlamydomonas_euryale.AAC.4
MTVPCFKGTPSSSSKIRTAEVHAPIWAWAVKAKAAAALSEVEFNEADAVLKTRNGLEAFGRQAQLEYDPDVKPPSDLRAPMAPIAAIVAGMQSARQSRSSKLLIKVIIKAACQRCLFTLLVKATRHTARQ